MAFVLSRTSSPQAPLIEDEHHHETPSHSHSEDHSTDSMGRVKTQKSRVEIHLDQQCVYLKGVGVDVEPTRISGYVAVYLTESTALKEITLNFKGKATLPIPPTESTMNNAPVLTYVICKHDWSFLEGDKSRSHTLKAGRHIFPFQLRIGGSLPSSIATPVFGGATITYRLRANVVRSGFSFGHNNFNVVKDVPIVRSFAPEAMEYQHTLEIENTWPEKVMYSILLPHKAWAAGDKLTALIKVSPLAKGVCVLSIQTMLQEQTKVYARSGQQETTRVIASTRHEIVNGKPVEVVEERRMGSAGFQPYSVPASPAATTPGTPAGGSAPSSRPASIAAATRVPDIQQLQTQLAQLPSSSSSHPSTSTSTTSTRPTTETEPQPPLTDFPDTSQDPDSADLITFLSLPIPLSLTPSHTLEPIIISHRVRWSILLLNPDGHTSELRCSLPVHLLDYRLLSESRLYSAPTRRLILGIRSREEGDEGEDGIGVEEEDVRLPSYENHVRDRVANMWLSENETMRVTNPWIAQGVSPVITPGSSSPPCPTTTTSSPSHTPSTNTAGAPSIAATHGIHSAPPPPPTTSTHPHPHSNQGQGTYWPRTRSGTSTPLEAHLLGNLPHQPGSDTSTPLDWVNSELLLSLSLDGPGPRVRREEVEEGPGSVPNPNGMNGMNGSVREGSRVGSPRGGSRGGSRVGSRMGSRAGSPERERTGGLTRNVDLTPPPSVYSSPHHRPSFPTFSSTFSAPSTPGGSRSGHPHAHPHSSSHPHTHPHPHVHSPLSPQSRGGGDTFLHHENSSSRHLPSLTTTSMKPLSSLSASLAIGQGRRGFSRSPSMPNVPTLADLENQSILGGGVGGGGFYGGGGGGGGVGGGPIRHIPPEEFEEMRRRREERELQLRGSSSTSTPATSSSTGQQQREQEEEEPTPSQLLHRAFTKVPDYEVAARGFIGGVPPLTSMRGLPSYEESESLSRGGSRSGSPKEEGVERREPREGEGVRSG